MEASVKLMFSIAGWLLAIFQRNKIFMNRRQSLKYLFGALITEQEPARRYTIIFKSANEPSDGEAASSTTTALGAASTQCHVGFISSPDLSSEAPDADTTVCAVPLLERKFLKFTIP